MSGNPVFVQLIWEDPIEGPRSATLQAPITIGRDPEEMPKQVSGQATSFLELDHKQVSRYHALITATNQRLTITDKSANGTFLNGRPLSRDGQQLTAKDTLRVGPFKITAAILRDGATNATELNPERSQQLGGGGNGPNAVVIGLIGILILLLMGVGTWAIAGVLLEQFRPTPDDTDVGAIIMDAERS